MHLRQAQLEIQLQKLVTVLYNLAISLHKYLYVYKYIFTNTYIFPNRLESSLAFIHLCGGPQWGLHCLAANSQGMLQLWLSRRKQVEEKVTRSFTRQ